MSDGCFAPCCSLSLIRGLAFGDFRFAISRIFFHTCSVFELRSLLARYLRTKIDIFIRTTSEGFRSRIEAVIAIDDTLVERR